MTLFSEKVLISNRRISGLMSNLIKKSWTDSNPGVVLLKNEVIKEHFADPSDLKISNSSLGTCSNAPVKDNSQKKSRFFSCIDIFS